MMRSDSGATAAPLPGRFVLAGIIASAFMLALYARGGHAWLLGFCVLVPWLITLNATRSFIGALINGWLMSVAYVLAAFGWFGSAIGAYTGVGTATATLVLCVLAPLLQPQILVFALTRHWIAGQAGPWLRMLSAAAAWVACEWLCTKLLGDTLGHGLYSSALLRQMADLGGAAGLSFLLILVNEALALLLARWRGGTHGVLPPFAMAVVLITLMFGYGAWRLHVLQSVLSVPTPSLRIGMVQSAIVDYEKLRRERSAYAVVREVLDTHFVLSHAAIGQHGVDALLWSETVYPTTFGHPRSADGAELDREILDFVDAAGVPLVFGSYDIDEGGEYNAAVFVEPGKGLLGYYRKTHPFPLTEHVPDWLESPLLRGWLPWMGSWQPGNGARVFPLRLTDGRELDVLPLICLDAVRPNLAVDGARLGAQAIVGLSNDSWFSSDPLGARLHLAVAAFRSIETRLPQLRVTSNGLSAIIDPTGAVIASTAMGDRAVLAGDVPLRDPPPTLMLRWGDWVGGAGLAFLMAVVALFGRRAWAARFARPVPSSADSRPSEDAYAAIAVALTSRWRIVSALLRISAGAGLLWLALGMLMHDGWQVHSLSQIRIYLVLVLLPAVVAWVIRLMFAANVDIRAGALILRQRHQRVEIPVPSISRMHVWRMALPSTGIDLELASGRRFKLGIALADPLALLRALAAAGAPVQLADRLSERIAEYASARAAAGRPWLDHAVLKFVCFPLLPALVAFRLHQHIAFGGTFGEFHTYGLGAYLIGLLIWWAAWSIGLMLFAAVLRGVIECIALLVHALRPTRTLESRHHLETLGRLVFYLGLPAWLALRIVAT